MGPCSVGGIIHLGTILHTARCPKFKKREGIRKAVSPLEFGLGPLESKTFRLKLWAPSSTLKGLYEVKIKAGAVDPMLPWLPAEETVYVEWVEAKRTCQNSWLRYP